MSPLSNKMIIMKKARTTNDTNQCKRKKRTTKNHEDDGDGAAVGQTRKEGRRFKGNNHDGGTTGNATNLTPKIHGVPLHLSSLLLAAIDSCRPPSHSSPIPSSLPCTAQNVLSGILSRNNKDNTNNTMTRATNTASMEAYLSTAKQVTNPMIHTACLQYLLSIIITGSSSSMRRASLPLLYQLLLHSKSCRDMFCSIIVGSSVGAGSVPHVGNTKRARGCANTTAKSTILYNIKDFVQMIAGISTKIAITAFSQDDNDTVLLQQQQQQREEDAQMELFRQESIDILYQLYMKLNAEQRQQQYPMFMVALRYLKEKRGIINTFTQIKQNSNDKNNNIYTRRDATSSLTTTTTKENFGRRVGGKLTCQSIQLLQENITLHGEKECKMIISLIQCMDYYFSILLPKRFIADNYITNTTTNDITIYGENNDSEDITNNEEGDEEEIDWEEGDVAPDEDILATTIASKATNSKNSNKSKSTKKHTLPSPSNHADAVERTLITMGLLTTTRNSAGTYISYPTSTSASGAASGGYNDVFIDFDKKHDGIGSTRERDLYINNDNEWFEEHDNDNDSDEYSTNSSSSSSSSGSSKNNKMVNNLLTSSDRNKELQKLNREEEIAQKQESDKVTKKEKSVDDDDHGDDDSRKKDTIMSKLSDYVNLLCFRFMPKLDLWIDALTTSTSADMNDGVTLVHRPNFGVASGADMEQQRKPRNAANDNDTKQKTNTKVLLHSQREARGKMLRKLMNTKASVAGCIATASKLGIVAGQSTKQHNHVKKSVLKGDNNSLRVHHLAFSSRPLSVHNALASSSSSTRNGGDVQNRTRNSAASQRIVLRAPKRNAQQRRPNGLKIKGYKS